MRLLRPSTIALSFDDLGIRGKAFEQLKAQVERPNGMIITTGPTGSGKTTTLYAILKKLNTADTKIITLEDPVEYSLEGVNQSPIDLSKDYTFAKGLRAILRQDPDVIMVGEIRDLETAETAIQAALTGHLMVSTIHTNSAAGAIPRFLSMGVKPFLLAPALNAVIGQRLVRRIDDVCKAETTINADQLKKVKDIMKDFSPEAGVKPDLEHLTFFKGAGCTNCGGSGYKGRMGIYEIFTMTPEIEKVILSGNVSEYQMQEIAVKQGMISMAQDGILKALEGITTIEEVLSVAE
jgi:type II secretory ATPase GspE/PulE/Tfp pilus assembly ATPase PilB-like protein